MTDAYFEGTDYQMLALESPKSHLLSGTRSLDKDRYVTIQNMEKRNKSYKSRRSDDYSDIRDGAINRTIETSAYVKKNSKRGSKLDISTQDFLKRDVLGGSRSKYSDALKPKLQSESLGYEGDTENYAIRKKTKKKGKKKGGFKDADILDKTKTRPIYLREKSFTKEAASKSITEQKGFARSKSNYGDFSLSHAEDDTSYKRLTSANRPKSAGQAMYISGYSSDSDGSFYDGEIEVLNLDDPEFAYEREFEEANRTKSNRTGETCVSKNTSNTPEFENFDNNENVYKQTTLSPENGSGSKKKRPQSDRTDSYPTARPTTSRGRRRTQSEPDVEQDDPDVPTTTEIPKSVQGYAARHYTKPLGSENFYNSSVDKVISKYSGLTVKKGSTKFPHQGNMHARSDLYQARAPLPRKLKPILRREKVGHIN